MIETTRSGAVKLLVTALAVVAAGCVGSGATPAPTPGVTTPAATTPASARATSTPATPTQPPVTPTPSPSTAPVSLYLRAWSVHGSIGPINNFGNAPLVISDGQLLAVPRGVEGPVPLYTAPLRRSLSQAALTTIVAEARAAGLLGTVSSFVCPPDASGGEVIGGPGPDYLVLVVDGMTHEVHASCPNVRPSVAPGTPEPATWAAFERFRALLLDPSSWLGGEAGPATTYDPDRLAVLVVPVEPAAPTPAPAQVVRWPLATPFASFGVPFSGARCAVVSGADAATLLAGVRTATADMTFRDARGASAQLIVRPFMPGEPDPCRE